MNRVSKGLLVVVWGQVRGHKGMLSFDYLYKGNRGILYQQLDLFNKGYFTHKITIVSYEISIWTIKSYLS